MLPQPSKNQIVSLETFWETVGVFKTPENYVVFRCGCRNVYCQGWRIEKKEDLDLVPLPLTLPVDVHGPLEDPYQY